MSIIEKALEKLDDERRRVRDALGEDDRFRGGAAGGAEPADEPRRPGAPPANGVPVAPAVGARAQAVAAPAAPPRTSPVAAAATPSVAPGDVDVLETPAKAKKAVLNARSADAARSDRQAVPARPGPAEQALHDEQERADVDPGRPTSQVVNLDLERLSAMGMLTPTSDRTMLAEQFRIIKRPLLMQVALEREGRRANTNLILITSALPSEGKTSTAINLAISIAQERDRTVLLIDADVTKSDISHNLGIEVELGLTDLLVDRTLQVPDVMLRTNIPKLSIIPAGRRHPNITELYSGTDMRDLMADLSRRYHDRVVIIDTPPLLATSGASVLASLAGQILMVVEAVRTPQRAVTEALRMLGPLDNIGLVLNKVRHRSGSYGYGYGYGYGGGDGYGYDAVVKS